MLIKLSFSKMMHRVFKLEEEVRVIIFYSVWFFHGLIFSVIFLFSQFNRFFSFFTYLKRGCFHFIWASGII
jgi:hypothetical protein